MKVLMKLALVTGAVVALAAPGCDVDRGTGPLGEAPASHPSDSTGGEILLTRRLRVFAGDGSVLAESVTTGIFPVVIEHGVARVDSGLMIAVRAGVVIEGGTATYTDDGGHVHEVVVTQGLDGAPPSKITFYRDGQLSGEIAFSWASSGDIFALAAEVSRMYRDTLLLAEETVSASGAEQIRLPTGGPGAVPVRALLDRGAASIMSGCGLEWTMYAAASVNVLLWAVVNELTLGAFREKLVSAAVAFFAAWFALIWCEMM